MRQKRVHLAKKSVKNTYPYLESRSKTRTLTQKVYVEARHHLGHQNASKTRTLSEKVRQKHVPFLKKSVGAGGFQGEVKNTYPQAKSASKTCTLRQKVGFEASKTRTLRQTVRQKHVPLGKKSAPVRLRDVTPGILGTLQGWKKTRVLSF